MKEEIIGKKITIIKSGNATLIGTKGKIIDETKNILTIETDGKVKKIIKDECVFEINGKVVDGKTISKRSEERIKQ